MEKKKIVITGKHILIVVGIISFIFLLLIFNNARQSSEEEFEDTIKVKEVEEVKEVKEVETNDSSTNSSLNSTSEGPGDINYIFKEFPVLTIIAMVIAGIMLLKIFAGLRI